MKGSVERQLETLSLDDKLDDELDEEKWIKHYSSSHKILIVGEGDFSFANCLAKAFGSAHNMVATSLDSHETIVLKYCRAARNLEKLEELGCSVMHEIDVHTMSRHPLLNHKLFDRIIFNFPHTALKRGEANIRQIQSHQRLVKGFMMNARELLAENGEVHVTHKTEHPYSQWEIEKLAGEVGLCLLEKVRFKLADYPGYNNKKGHGMTRANETFHVGACKTFKFVKIQV